MTVRGCWLALWKVSQHRLRNTHTMKAINISALVTGLRRHHRDEASIMLVGAPDHTNSAAKDFEVPVSCEFANEIIQALNSNPKNQIVLKLILSIQ